MGAGGRVTAAGIIIFGALLIATGVYAWVSGFMSIPNKGATFSHPALQITTFILYGIGAAMTLLLIGGVVVVIAMLMPRRKDFDSEDTQRRTITEVRLIAGEDGEKSKALKPPDRVVEAHPTHAE